MKRSAKAILTLVLLVACAALVGAATEEKASAGYSTDVSIQPGGNDIFVLKAKIKDISSGEIVAGPTVRMPAGQTANTESTLSDSNTVVNLSANVDGAKHSATYTVTIKRGQKVIAEHSATVAL